MLTSMTVFLQFHQANSANAVRRRNAQVREFLFNHRNIVNVYWAVAPESLDADSLASFK